MALSESSPKEEISQLVAHLERDGYLIFLRVLDDAACDRIREALDPYLQKKLLGRNPFEGHDSERVYALLAKSPVFAELVAHPLVMQLAARTLGEGFLLSACLAIHVHPGETPQALHFDDAFYRVPRPRPAYSLSTFWAIDAFTEDNGATEIIPGSHRWGDLDLGPLGEEGQNHPDLVKAIMPRGSLMVCPGTLWHRGGANRSAGPRLAITPQYCVTWARQQETMLLAVPPELAATYPEEVQSLLGYNVHPPFMGHVNGMHPRRVMGRSERARS